LRGHISGMRVLPNRLLTGMAACLAAATMLACRPARSYHGVVIDPPRKVATFTFRRADASALSTLPNTGQVQLVFFGYTNCPDVCSTILADWARARRTLGADTARVRFLFVTVDPARDTPAVTQRYASQFSDGIVGLSGDSATTERMQTAFGVASERGAGSTNYFMGHSSQTFVVNDQGDIVLMFGYGTEWQSIAADLHTLLQ
jgi:protein SCO1/2